MAASVTIRFRAFISYRHTPDDRRWAKWLHTAIETYTVPRNLVAKGVPRRLGKVFRDEEELAASASLSDRITEALEAAEFLIVVCSPETPGSRWVNEEIKRFQALGRSDRVLALLVAGEPETAFPLALQDIEPLAADVRPTMETSDRQAKKTALLKLNAAILRIDFDELRRRDDERARKRLIWLLSTSVAATLVFFGLALFALQQWMRAERELKMSTAQRLAVSARSAYIEGTYSTMIGTADPQRGVLLALESLNIQPSVQGDEALRVGLWRIASKRLTTAIGGSESLVAIGHDGSWIGLSNEVCVDKLNRILVYDAKAGKFIDAPSPDQKAVAAAFPEDSARPYVMNELCGSNFDPETTVLTRSVNGDVGLAENEDGVGTLGAYRIVDLANNKTLWHVNLDWALQFAAFSDDGRWLVTVSGRVSMDASEPGATSLPGSLVSVWDVETQRRVTAVSLAIEGGISNVAISPDRAWLATQTPGIDGDIIQLWPLWPDALRAEACQQVTRNLSDSEWATWVQRPRQGQALTCPGLPIVSE